ncbi:hypothetical protein HY486_04050 [Candidatus Woesearchaeota archaeon]|nr:hypothetical protein [Candidatus Woesearchaeota archaeon]
MNLKRLIMRPRMLVLIFFILVSLWIINPGFSQGVAISAVTKNSSAEASGIESPKFGTLPRDKEVIKSVNGVVIDSVEDYYREVSNLVANDSVMIKTNKRTHVVKVRERLLVSVLNETMSVFVNESFVVNGSEVNRTVEKRVPKTKTEVVGVEDMGIRVVAAPTNNIRKGLDLQGGTRVVLSPSEEVSADLLDALIDNLRERLNVYGLADINIAPITSGIPLPGMKAERFILIEMAGVTDEEVKDLLGRQGKFEAKVSNLTVFKGGEDITYVCRTSQCAGLDTNSPCGQSENGFACGFSFQITLSGSAATRFADATAKLGEVLKGSQKYLTEPIVLYLDDEEVDRLEISAGLKGRPTTEISISGSGSGSALQGAMDSALLNMKRLQTILITGSLPAKLEIERVDTVSPVLGAEFAKNALFVALLAFVSVVIVLIIAYKRIIIALPILLTAVSEVLITLGIASLIGWNIDLSAVAGIIAAIGTGVDDQIVITDEIFGKHRQQQLSWKARLKNAFFIIFSAYFVTVVAMIPLWFAGAGLLKGFAVTTILGVSAGVLITRPAYGVFLEELTNESAD